MSISVSKAKKADGETHTAQSEPPYFNFISFSHPKAWVNKLGKNEGKTVLKEV